MRPFVSLGCVLSFLMSCGGDEEVRTLDPLRARQVLSQLSYTPINITANASGFLSFLKVLFSEPSKLNNNFLLSLPLLTGVSQCLFHHCHSP